MSACYFGHDTALDFHTLSSRAPGACRTTHEVRSSVILRSVTIVIQCHAAARQGGDAGLQHECATKLHQARVGGNIRVQPEREPRPLRCHGQRCVHGGVCPRARAMTMTMAFSPCHKTHNDVACTRVATLMVPTRPPSHAHHRAGRSAVQLCIARGRAHTARSGARGVAARQHAACLTLLAAGGGPFSCLIACMTLYN